MPSKLIAETLLREVNKAQARATRLRVAAKHAAQDADAAEESLAALLAESKRQGIYYITDQETGDRTLDPPTKGWD